MNKSKTRNKTVKVEKIKGDADENKRASYSTGHVVRTIECKKRDGIQWYPAKEYRKEERSGKRNAGSRVVNSCEWSRRKIYRGGYTFCICHPRALSHPVVLRLARTRARVNACVLAEVKKKKKAEERGREM